MKTLFILFISLVSSYSLSAQAPPIQWQKSIGGTSGDEFIEAHQTRDKGFICIGSSWSKDGDVTVNNGAVDLMVVKTDSLGTIKWLKIYGGSHADAGASIQQTSDGGYIAAGISMSNDGDVLGHKGSTDSADCWVLKLDSVGNIQWQKSIGGTREERSHSIHQTFDGGYILGASTLSTNGDVTGLHSYYAHDFWAVKLDPSGNIEWQNTLGGTGDDILAYLEQTADSGYILTGISQSDDGDVPLHHGTIWMNDCWLVKLDAKGNLQWQKVFGGPTLDGGEEVRQTDDGGYIIGGFNGTNGDDVTGNHDLHHHDIWVIKTDNTGNIQWTKSLGGTEDDSGFGIQVTRDSGCIVIGTVVSIDGDVTGNHSGGDSWAAKLDASGNLEWQKCLGGSGFERMWGIEQTSDGGYITAGGSSSLDGDITSSHGAMGDAWLVKLGGFPTDIESEMENISFVSVYPNPANGQLTIKANDGIDLIEISNVLGQTVLITPGQNERKTVIDVSSLTRGVYFVKLINKSGETQVTKLILK